MAKFIINEGSGPRTVDLQGSLTLGSNPSCDVVLQSSTALGNRCELRPLRWGYRVVKEKGELFVNEHSVEMADLDHGDTLRIGAVLLLYKQPEGDDFAGGSAAGGLELVELEELALPELELIDESTVVAEPPPRREGDSFQRGRWKRIEALRRLSLAQQGTLGAVPALSEIGALDWAAEIDSSGAVGEWDTYEHTQGIEDKTLRELLLLIDDTVASVPAVAVGEELEELELLEEFEELEELEVLEEIEPRHAHETVGMDDAMVRARHKRLEALRRVRLARDGDFAQLPGLSDAGALDVVRALDESGSAGELEAFEYSAGLGDRTVTQLLEEVEARRHDAEIAAAEAAAAEAAAAEAAAAEAAAAEAAAAEAAAAEAAAAEAAAAEAAAAEAAAAEAAAAEAAAAEAAAAEAEVLDLEELEELEVLEDFEDLTSATAAAPSAPEPVLSAPRPVLTQGVRPLPVGGVPFSRPLPPGRPAPTYLPPVHPGRRSA